mmetsp:Transcript_22037/g.26028  ORF Transcript_22037/g.26028 Transcript_22037/m.26028 type:complete len:81 (-) Transcript_22037:91-333(-)
MVQTMRPALGPNKGKSKQNGNSSTKIFLGICIFTSSDSYTWPKATNSDVVCNDGEHTEDDEHTEDGIETRVLFETKWFDY